MLKKMKRSIELMPRPAYIFLKITFILCDLILLNSSLLFLNNDEIIGYGKRLMLARLSLETPSGLLLIALIGFAIIYDNC